MVTFLTPMAYEPCSISKIRSTNKNGYRWGKSFMMASMSIFIGKALPKPFGSDPGSGVFSAAIALVVRRTIGRRLLCCLRVVLMVAVINDDEAEERADMTVMLLALVVVVVVLSRVLRVKSSIMRRKWITTFYVGLIHVLLLINVRNNSKPDNLAVPFPIVSVFQLALFTVA